MENKISHRGIVERIEGENIRVKIVQHSACSACKVKSLCSSSESKEKSIDIQTSDASRYKIGEEVMVYAGLSVGRTAVILAFVIPLVLLIISLITSIQVIGMEELSAIGISFLLLILYYVVLALNKKRLNRRFTFYITKLDSY